MPKVDLKHAWKLKTARVTFKNNIIAAPVQSAVNKVLKDHWKEKKNKPIEENWADRKLIYLDLKVLEYSLKTLIIKSISAVFWSEKKNR